MSNYPKNRKSRGRKGKTLFCSECKKEFYVFPYTLLGKSKLRFCSKKCHTKSGVFTRKGLVTSEIHRKKISEKSIERVKNGTHNLWKGGKTSERMRIYNSIEYKIWRRAVFERDNYTCQICGLKFVKGDTGNVVLQADHIKPQSIFPELRFDISNGRTLCIDCHRKTDTWGIRHRLS